MVMTQYSIGLAFPRATTSYFEKWFREAYDPPSASVGSCYKRTLGKVLDELEVTGFDLSKVRKFISTIRPASHEGFPGEGIIDVKVFPTGMPQAENDYVYGNVYIDLALCERDNLYSVLKRKEYGGGEVGV
jgi:hypothetical protein